MNSTNDLVSSLINCRERIADKLLQNYSYDYLLSTFKEINEYSGSQIKIKPSDSDKLVHRLLSGSYHNSRYTQSSIDWIPSKELVDALAAMANYFKIRTVEEIYAGIGLFSAMFKKSVPDIIVTTSDPFTNPNTCNQLGLVPIARRSLDDFKYYSQLNEPYPEMIISSYYPPDFGSADHHDNTHNFINEISNLIQSQHHSIIIVIVPHILTNIHDIMYYYMIQGKYNVYTYHVKVIEKYFYLSNLMEKQYPSTMLVHILVKKDLFGDENPHQIISSIMQEAIIPVNFIDKNCTLVKWIRKFFEKFSSKLTKNIYQICDMGKTYNLNKKITDIMDFFTVNHNRFPNILIPQYFLEIDEFLLWMHCWNRNIYLIFENRGQFFDFYVAIRKIETVDPVTLKRTQKLLTPEEYKLFGLPKYVNSLNDIYKFFYMKTIKAKGSWRIGRSMFDRNWKTLNDKNLQALTGETGSKNSNQN